MRYLYLLIMSLAAFSIAAPAQAQVTRGLGAQTFVLDNGPGNTLTIVYTGEGNAFLTLPPASVLPPGESSMTLRYDHVPALVTSDSLLNTGTMVGVIGGVRYHVSTVTADATLGDEDYYVIADDSEDNIQITLPPASTGRAIVIRDIAGGQNITSILPSGTDTIEGLTDSIELNFIFAGLTLVADQSDWKVVNILYSSL